MGYIFKSFLLETIEVTNNPYFESNAIVKTEKLLSQSNMMPDYYYMQSFKPSATSCIIPRE